MEILIPCEAVFFLQVILTTFAETEMQRELSVITEIRVILSKKSELAANFYICERK